MNLAQLFNATYLIRYRNAEGNYRSNLKKGCDYRFFRKEDTLIIFFECTRSTHDWLINLSFWKKPYKDMRTPYKVHTGFLKYWKQVEDRIIEVVTARGDDGKHLFKHIYISGYSQGGALAGLCHECVWFHRPDLRADGLYTFSFEGPRFCASFALKRTIRDRWIHFYQFINDKDIVPHLPPRIFGYTHVGQIIHYGRGRKLGFTESHYPDIIKTSLREFSPAEVIPNVSFSDIPLETQRDNHYLN